MQRRVIEALRSASYAESDQGAIVASANCGRLCDLLDDKAVDANKELNRI
jgi:hypothetical protein